MTLKQKYLNLPEREQKLLLIAAVVLIVFIFFSLIWQPMNNRIEQARTAIENQQGILAELNTKAAKITMLRQNQGAGGSFQGSLTQVANQTAGRFGIAITRMQPRNDQLQIWVEQAEYNQFVRWLDALDNQGIVILDTDIAQTSTPGMINVRSLVLSK